MAQINEDFFEQQRIFTLLCGMHSINNLLAAPIYSKQQMNNICYQLSDAFINPHKHILGGDYDANVVLIALQNQQCTTKWHDRRKQFAIREAINEEGQELQLIGYIINKFQGEGILNKIFRFSPRHWIAVRKEGQKYRFLDSSEEATEVCTREEVFRRISELLVNNNEPEQSNEVIEVYRAK